MIKNQERVEASVFPHYWPVLSLCGGTRPQRDRLTVEVQHHLRENNIRCLVVKAGREHLAATRENPILSGQEDVVFFGDDLCHAVTGVTGMPDLLKLIASHVNSCDIILLDTCVAAVTGEVVQLHGGGELSPQSFSRVVFTLGRDGDSRTLTNFLQGWLQKKVSDIPVWACILIGGESRRMGRPKHLIDGEDSRTWLEATVERLEQVTAQVVLSGKGDVPSSLRYLPRLVDIPDCVGPMAGILSAMRWNPAVSWLVAACDMPDIQKEGLLWLLGRREPGTWGSVPRHPHSNHFDPLLAHYDFRCRQIFEALYLQGSRRIGRICEHAKVTTPPVPEELVSSWRNCNTPEDLKKNLWTATN